MIARQYEPRRGERVQPALGVGEFAAGRAHGEVARDDDDIRLQAVQIVRQLVGKIRRDRAEMQIGEQRDAGHAAVRFG